jgi:Fe-S-cluster containining protein
MQESPQPAPIITAPEQNLCVICGLCCDGTLFKHAPLTAEDRLHTDGSFDVEVDPEHGGYRFRQPCHHLHGRICSLYQTWRPEICHTYRCKLLKRHHAGEISLTEAQAIVQRTRTLADRIRFQIGQLDLDSSGSLADRVLELKAQTEPIDVAARASHAQLLLDYALLCFIRDRDFQWQKAKEKPDHGTTS